MTDEQIYEISNEMLKEFPTMGKNYMFCIVRQAILGLDKPDVKKGVREALDHYFCAWNTNVNEELTESFMRVYKK